SDLLLDSMDLLASFPVFTLSYNFSKTGLVASLKGFHQSKAPLCAVVEQLAYIQSIPFSATRGIKLWVSSSTVSLNASDGLCPFALNTSYWAAKIPWIAPISVPLSPVKSEVTSL